MRALVGEDDGSSKKWACIHGNDSNSKKRAHIDEEYDAIFMVRRAHIDSGRSRNGVGVNSIAIDDIDM